MADQTWKGISLNDTVRVRLLPKGRLIYRRKMQALNERLVQGAKPFDLEPELDAEGLYSTQLWCLMRDFGEHITMGMEPPFKIQFEVRDA